MEEKTYKKSKTFTANEEDSLIHINKNKTGYESCISCCGSFWGCFRAWCPCICCCCPYPYFLVSQGQIGLLTEFGKYQKVLQPGFHNINPCAEQVQLIDTKTFSVSISDSVVLTKDNIQMTIDTVLYYRLVDPVKATYRISNIRSAIIEVTQSVLRTICGEYTLQDLLIERLAVAQNLHETIDAMVSEWGVYMEKVFIKDQRLNEDLRKALSMAGTARKETEAQIIGSQADVEAAKYQREVSDILDSKPAMQIRFLQAINQIARGPSRKIVMMGM